ncbi:hypothetical protein Tco_0546763 [Tanacetum coccineum]
MWQNEQLGLCLKKKSIGSEVISECMTAAYKNLQFLTNTKAKDGMEKMEGHVNLKFNKHPKLLGAEKGCVNRNVQGRLTTTESITPGNVCRLSTTDNASGSRQRRRTRENVRAAEKTPPRRGTRGQRGGAGTSNNGGKGFHTEEMVENYKPANPRKIPSEILALEGKRCVFQFHFNTMANITDFTPNDVFDIDTQDQGTSSSAEERDKETSPAAVSLTVEPVKNQEEPHKEKETPNAEKEVTGTPPTSPIAVAQPVKNPEQHERGKEKTAKRPLFQQPPTDSKKPKGD